MKADYFILWAVAKVNLYPYTATYDFFERIGIGEYPLKEYNPLT